MKANNENEKIIVNFTADEALILLDWLSKFDTVDESNNFVNDQAVQRILWDLEAVLEQCVPMVTSEDYLTLLKAAKSRIQD